MTTLEKLLKHGEEKGFQIGFKEGFKEGFKIGKIAPILNMHEAEFPISTITKIQEVTEAFAKKVIAGEITEDDYNKGAALGTQCT